MKKLAISAIICSLILLSIIIYFPNLSLLYLIKSRYSVSKTPWAYIVPIDRNLEGSIDGLNSYQTFVFDDFKFKVPWKELKLNKKMETGLLLSFLDNQNKSVFVTRSKIAALNFEELLVKENPADAEKIKLFWGNDIFKSEYAIYDECLSTSPDQINIFSAKSKLGNTFMLLTLKSILTRYNVNKIYRFQTQNLTGFQFGDPETKEIVEAEFFNSKGKFNRMEFISVNQNDIDYILSSVGN